MRSVAERKRNLGAKLVDKKNKVHAKRNRRKVSDNHPITVYFIGDFVLWAWELCLDLLLIIIDE